MQHKTNCAKNALFENHFRNVFRDSSTLINTIDGAFLPIHVTALSAILDWYNGNFGNKGIFIDAGSGDNRVVIAANIFGFKQSIGIESDPVIFNRGLRNANAFFSGKKPECMNFINDDFTKMETYIGLDLNLGTTVYHFINREPLEGLVRLIGSRFPGNSRLLLVDVGHDLEFPGFLVTGNTHFRVNDFEYFIKVYEKQA